MRKPVGEKNPALERAIWDAGGPTVVARALGVSWHTVYKWRTRGFVETARGAVLLSEMPGVTASVRELAWKLGELPMPPNGGRRENGQADEASEARGHEGDTPEPEASTVSLLGRRRQYPAPSDRRGPKPPSTRYYTRYKVSPLDDSSVDVADAA